jgi:hypothetical protein
MLIKTAWGRASWEATSLFDSLTPILVWLTAGIFAPVLPFTSYSTFRFLIFPMFNDINDNFTEGIIMLV